MRAGARSLGALFVAGSLLGAACQPQPRSQPQPPRAAPAPPSRGLTICERPPKPAAAPADPKIEASFRAFARTWIGKMGKAGSAPGAPSGRRRIRDEFEIELRPTGSKQAPWIGVLRYCEETLRCTSANAASCQVSKSTAVSEIFRFEAGKWTY